MSASQIAVNSFYSDAAGIYRTLRYTAETIVGITTYKATRMAFDSLLYPYRDPEKMF